MNGLSGTISAAAGNHNNGVFIVYNDSNTVKNTTITGFDTSINFGGTRYNTADNNTVDGNIVMIYGGDYNFVTNNKLNGGTIAVAYASGNLIKGNVLTNTKGDGIYLGLTSGVPEGNTVIGNSITAAAGNTSTGIHAVNASGNNIIGNGTAAGANTITGFDEGIRFDHSSGTINRNTVLNSGSYGIRVTGSDGIAIKLNTITTALNGVELENSNNTVVNNNTISDAGNGITTYGGSNTTIHGNSIASKAVSDVSTYGIFLGSSINNEVTDNDLSGYNHSGAGIEAFGYVGDTLISNNRIFNNTFGIALNPNNWGSGNVSIIGNDIHDNYIGAFVWHGSNNTLLYRW